MLNIFFNFLKQILAFIKILCYVCSTAIEKSC